MQLNKAMYDIIIVGAGLTAASICATLKHRYKILVLDIRHHIGGNCYDYNSNGTFIHKYGPHIFHSPSSGVVSFLSEYTKWIKYDHKVSAELEDGRLVPFPYSLETANALGKQLSQEEVINIFFKPYSKKMWGKDWSELPDSIKNRIPKDTNQTSNYFINQFTAFPAEGYTKMIEKMFSGVDVILGTPYDAWTNYLGCGTIIYCGRPDRIMLKNRLRVGNLHGDWLKYRNLDFTFTPEPWEATTPVVNFCHDKSPFTRKSCFRNLLGGNSPIVTYERPIEACVTDETPFYFYPSEENTNTHLKIRDIIKKEYPNLILAGRLGTSSYLDMYGAIQQGINIGRNLI